LTYSDHMTSNAQHVFVRFDLVFRQNYSVCQRSAITFVDLASSEKQGLFSSIGDRRNDSMSLSTLSVVIWALADNHANKGPKAHVPFTDSVLTVLLKEALTGNS
jgi:hypothetical protein